MSNEMSNSLGTLYPHKRKTVGGLAYVVTA